MDRISVETLKVKVPVSGTTGPNGVQTRAIKDMKKLLNSGVNFDTYQIREDETLRFASFKDTINPDNGLLIERQVSKGSPNYFTLVKCESEYKGQKKVTYFSLPSLKRTGLSGELLDQQDPVNPTWYELGNDLNRLRYLCAMGEITGLKEVSINTPKEFVADKDGKLRPKQIQLKNDDGTPKLVKGQEVWVTECRTAHPVTITPVDTTVDLEEIPADVQL